MIINLSSHLQDEKQEQPVKRYDELTSASTFELPQEREQFIVEKLQVNLNKLKTLSSKVSYLVSEVNEISRRKS